MKPTKILEAGVSRKRFELGEIRETKLMQQSADARRRFPFYFMLVDAGFNTPLKQLQWKIYVRTRCIRDADFRKAIWATCKADVAFFAVTFCWIFEPRPPRAMPFSPWVDQIDLLAWMDECFPERSFGNSKTRGIGLTWLCTIFFYHKWLFWPEVKIAVLTKDKDLLESQDDNSLLGKFCYIHSHMPAWARLDDEKLDIMQRTIESHTLLNRITKGVIQGFVSTNTKLRSMRFTALWADEFAFYGRDAQEWMVSSGGTTHCRFFISTWNSFDDMFHHVMYAEDSSMLKTFSYWWNNYERWKGAYKMESGRVIYVDKNYDWRKLHPEGYPFGQPDIIPEGTLRSPWVDAELLEPGIDAYKALRDIYGMSVCERDSAFFRPETRMAMKASIKTPDIQGILDETAPEYKLLLTNKSEVRIWGNPGIKDTGPYIAGFDLAFGTGASYTTMQVLDAGGEQVLEYGSNTTDIKVFAANAVKIARYLSQGQGDGWVLLDFEANGSQAKTFYEELERLQYAAVHTNPTKTTARFRHGFKARYHGTWNEDGHHANFKELERAVLSLDCVVKSEKVWEESKLFGKDDDGTPTFPRMSKLGHGDFMSGLGIAWNRARTIVSIENRADFQHPETEVTEPWLKRGAVFDHSTKKLWSSSWR